MLSKLREVKPSVESHRVQFAHAMKIDQYKRNLSKFRNAGRSQPRSIRNKPITVSADNSQLPEINRYSGQEAKPYLADAF